MTTKNAVIEAVEGFLEEVKKDSTAWAHAHLDGLVSFLQESAPIIRNDMIRAVAPTAPILVPNDGSDVSISAQQVEAQAELAAAPAVPGEEPVEPVKPAKKGKAAAAPAPTPAPTPAPAPEAAPAPAEAPTPEADKTDGQ